MGQVVVPIVVSAPGGSRHGETLKAFVDTVATLSMIPGDVLRRLGVRPIDEMPVRLADGRVVRRAVGEARLRVDGHVVTSRVMFGKRHDATVLGLVVLESLGLTVDPSKGKIVKGELLLLTMATQRPRGIRTNA